MSKFSIETEQIIKYSAEISGSVSRMYELRTDVDNVRSALSFNGAYNTVVDYVLLSVMKNMLDEAVKMNTMSEALKTIAQKYREAENDILGNSDSTNAEAGTGTDKRGLWEKFKDWVRGREADSKQATGSEQESAVDLQMRQELWDILQDPKYSEAAWANYSEDERKQILTEYYSEVMRVYGLEGVDAEINWDSSLQFDSNGITYGYYRHSDKSVTLNPNVLSDPTVSYHLLQTVGHELRHAYQHAAIDNPTRYQVTQETIDTWKYNFDNYIKSDEDFSRYVSQPVEVDARNFGVDGTAAKPQ